MNLHEILTDIHALENEIQQIRRKAPSLAGLVRVAVWTHYVPQRTMSYSYTHWQRNFLQYVIPQWPLYGEVPHLHEWAEKRWGLKKGKDPLFDLRKVAVETGIKDLAEHHDHYLYGVSKW